MKRILFAFLFIVNYSSYSQGEFILEIDATTGSFIQPNAPINGVTWVAGKVSTYDEIHGLYIFPSSSPYELISVNSNDSVFFNPSFASINECQYDNSSSILYGLQNPAAGQFIFGSVNPSTASYSQIGSGPISGMNGISQGMSTFDKNNHRYIIYASGNMFSIDALTGNVLSNPAAILNPGEGLVHICYDDSTNSLYGLLQNSVQTFLVLINTTTGVVTKIGSGTTYGFGAGTSTIDKINRRYIYDYPLSGSYYVAVMDIPTGNIIFNNVVPFASGGNINSIRYDNVRKKLFAEHWDASVTGISQYSNLNSNISIYPNPNNGSFVIETNSAAKQTVQVYDVNGKLILSQNIKGKTSIDASSLSDGVYNINITTNEGVVNKRLVIVR